VRIAEFVLLAALGFFIAYGYVAEFLRQYAAALALTSVVAVVPFQALGLYRIAGLASLDRQLPRLLAGWTAILALLLNFLLQGRGDLLAGLAGALVPGGSVGLIAFRGGDLWRRPILRRASAGAGEGCRQRFEDLRRI